MSQQDRAAPPPEAAEVRRLIAQGNSHTAVEAAKKIHRWHNNAASEAVLVEAYLARMRSLVEHGMSREAEALEVMIRERYPSSAALLNGALPPAGARLEELVRPLAGGATGDERPRAIERELRTTLADPGALAACPALPDDHPLRAAARLVAQALDAVTSRPVQDAELDLPEISRRSPLAPWKPLLRAIACFYRHDNAGCERNLAAIDADSAPAQLAPLLRSLMGDEARERLRPAATNLAKQVGGNLARLRQALHNTDTALREGDRKPAVQAIRTAAEMAERDCPEILPSLRQQIALRASISGLSSGAVDSAMGGPVRRDAAYVLMLARAMEIDENAAMEACLTWNEFLGTAVKEGWFPARGLEAGMVYLHMAELADRASNEETDWFRQEFQNMINQLAREGAVMPEGALPPTRPEWLYGQACAMDPHPEAFARWLAWSEKNPKKSPPAETAQTWHKALPDDPRPLLWLTRDAENRNALTKALGYLAQAEALDGLHPEVRRARFRLLVRNVIQHLQQRKPRLAWRKLEALEALPYAAEGDRPALVAGLRFIAAQLDGDQQAAAARSAEVEALLGKRAAALALAGMSGACGQPAGVDTKTVSGVDGSWVEAAGRGVALGREMGFVFCIPQDWLGPLQRELNGGTKASPLHLEALCGAALENGWREMAYAATTAGMAAGAEHEARFLLLRARCLPPWEVERADECLAAAVELARRRGDTALAGKALEMRRGPGLLQQLLGETNERLTERDLKKVLERERR